MRLCQAKLHRVKPTYAICRIFVWTVLFIILAFLYLFSPFVWATFSNWQYAQTPNILLRSNYNVHSDNNKLLTGSRYWLHHARMLFKMYEFNTKLNKSYENNGLFHKTAKQPPQGCKHWEKENIWKNYSNFYRATITFLCLCLVHSINLNIQINIE